MFASIDARISLAPFTPGAAFELDVLMMGVK
jgi:hypothetical protein